jgi:nucleotide-binding universal stress UspA family protein
VEVPPAWYGASGETAFGAWVMPELVKARRNELAAFRTEELEESSVQPCVQSGDAAAIIARVAHQKNISLIMLPTHGYGPVRGLSSVHRFFGSSVAGARCTQTERTGGPNRRTEEPMN